MRITTIAAYFALSTLCASAQVLTRAVVDENPSALPSVSVAAPGADLEQRPLHVTYAAPLPSPLTLVTVTPVTAPTRKLKELAARYNVDRIGDRNIAAGVNFYSLDREVAMGRELSQQVEQQSKLLNDAAVEEYVNRIGQQLVRNSDAKVPFVIKVIDSDEVNAFALPGGFFYVNTGLLLAADNEAELAGVMAHEIAHVAARHATRNRTKAQMFNLASIPLSMIGGPAVFALRNVAGIAVPLGFMKFSRDAEREADLLGIEYAYKSGYDPRAMVDLFERLDVQTKDRKKPGLLSKAFATHPMNGERIERAQQEIAYILPARDAYIETTSEFDQIKARLLDLQGGSRLRIQPGKATLRVKDQASQAAANSRPSD